MSNNAVFLAFKRIFLSRLDFDGNLPYAIVKGLVQDLSPGFK